MNTAIIPAAGEAKRIGKDKLFIDCRGRPLIAHTISAFENCPEIDDIIVVSKPNKRSIFNAFLDKEGWKKVRFQYQGGTKRHLSVAAGLRMLHPDCKYILVHDGARPLISSKTITKCIEIVKMHGALACAKRINDTVKRTDKNGRIIENVNRNNLWAMETPQVFEKNLLCNAYEKILVTNTPVTDEVSAIQHYGHPVYLYENGEINLKVTYPQDITTIRHLINKNNLSLG